MNMDRSAERLARAGLSRVVEPGDPTAAGAIAGRDVTELWAELGSGTRPAWAAARFGTAEPERDLDAAETVGGRFVIPGDPEWPERVEVLGRSGEISRRCGVPFGLWVRGSADLRAVTARSVALVGARACTSYGEHVAGELAAGLADQGVTVVSGGAYGIDAAAHRGALAAAGVTVAVLACGIDVGYPKGNAALFERIADGGLVVSELPPGCSPTRLRFLARNRLIAALTDGTVVVEAAARSGALNTASWADRCGLPVLAVPGPVTSATSHGAHILVRERGAILVTGVQDIVEATAPLGDALTSFPRGDERVTDPLSEVAQRVLDAVPVRVGAAEQSIARTAGQALDRVREGLAELLRAGLVERAGSGWRLSAARREEVR
jgi:DNA processing protein